MLAKSGWTYSTHRIGLIRPVLFINTYFYTLTILFVSIIITKGLYSVNN